MLSEYSSGMQCVYIDFHQDFSVPGEIRNDCLQNTNLAHGHDDTIRYEAFVTAILPFLVFGF
jgi:hypothetical protein